MSTENNEEEQGGKKFLVAHFKVPVKFGEDADGNKTASFQEIDHKNNCFKIEEVIFTTSDEAVRQSEKLQDSNNKTLRMAALSSVRKEGDLITRIILCNDGDVTVNPELV